MPGRMELHLDPPPGWDQHPEISRQPEANCVGFGLAHAHQYAGLRQPPPRPGLSDRARKQRWLAPQADYDGSRRVFGREANNRCRRVAVKAGAKSVGIGRLRVASAEPIPTRQY